MVPGKPNADFPTMTLRALLLGLLLPWLTTSAWAADAPPACELKRKLVFAGLDWDSNAFHTAVAQRIARDGYGCAVDSIPGSTITLINAVARGEVQVIMEVWKSNTPPAWTEGVAAGKLVELGVNFPDATQGWYVPRYLVEGTDAPAKGLAGVQDLPRFKALFADPELPTKGRFLNCPAGWQCELYNSKKLAAYGLEPHFTNFRPGTGAAMDAAIHSAVLRKKPVLFYYWGPTWLLGQLGKDLLQLQEPAYDAAVWKTLSDTPDPKNAKAATAYPVVQVVVGANKAFVDQAPRLAQFLKNYRTNAELVSQALAYMREHNGSADAAAVNFLATREDLWGKWVPPEVAARVKAKLR
jgi:glycine betaine/proline transport system substrate-binding protein